MQYREVRIADERSPIHCVWQLRGRSAEAQRVVTDARCELIVHLGPPSQELRQEDWITQQPVLVAGQMTRPVFLCSPGETNAVGVRLRSWATGAVLRTPADMTTDQILDLGAVHSQLSNSLTAAVQIANRDFLRAVHDLQWSFCHTLKPPDARLLGIVRYAEQRAGQCTVDALTHIAGVSTRQMDRMMLANVGVSPKLFLRMLRFRRAVAMHERLASWAEVAAQSGYHDQSHLIRDFKQFVGQPPSIAMRPESDLARHFTEKE